MIGYESSYESLLARKQPKAFLVVMARDEVQTRERLWHDPWYAQAMLALVWLKRWRSFIASWEPPSGA